jgi:hypothetical protein
MNRKKTMSIVLSCAMFAATSLFVRLAAADEGTPNGPLCIEQSPACVKEIHFLDTKSGCRLLDPGTHILQGSIFQVRRQVFLDRSVNHEGLPGDEGWIVSTANSDIDVITGNGIAWGTFLKVLDEVPATLYGTYTGVLVAGVFSGTATGRGTGAFEGYLFEADAQQMPLSELPGGDPCPSGSISGNGQTLDSTLRIDPQANSNAH